MANDHDAPLDRRLRGVHCPRCLSTRIEHEIRGGHQSFTCLRCVHNWLDQRRIATPRALPSAPLEHAIETALHAADLGRVIAAVLTSARTLAAADGAALLLRVGDTCYGAAEDAATPVWKGKFLPLDANVAGWVIHRDTRAFVADVTTDTRRYCDDVRGTEIRSVLALPIRKRNVVAVVAAYWHQRNAIHAAYVPQIELLAEALGVALCAARFETITAALIESLVQRRAADLARQRRTG